MREIHIKISCDLCGEGMPEDKITLFTGRTPTGKRLQLDLCTSCLSYANPAIETKRSKSSSNAHRCPVCSKPHNTEQGLKSHRTRQGH